MRELCMITDRIPAKAHVVNCGIKRSSVGETKQVSGEELLTDHL